jgi:hypothetical protein
MAEQEILFKGLDLDSNNVFKKIRKSKVYINNSLEPHLTGYYYLFMTKPDLNLSEANLKTLDLTHNGKLFNDYDKILVNLNRNVYLDPSIQDTNVFIPLITNLHKTVPIKDIASEATTGFETFDGYGMVIGGHSKNSRTKSDFSITYNELKGLPILNLHRVWLKYIDMCDEGYIRRSAKNVANRIIDYASSLYVFATEPDGVTINYWAKYTGIFPTGVPWSSLGENLGEIGNITPSITYKYTYLEENDLEIIRDFISLTYRSSFSPTRKGLKNDMETRYTYKSRDDSVIASSDGIIADYTNDIYSDFSNVTIVSSHDRKDLISLKPSSEKFKLFFY